MTETESILKSKWIIWTTCPSHTTSLREAKAETPATDDSGGRNWCADHAGLLLIGFILMAAQPVFLCHKDHLPRIVPTLSGQGILTSTINQDNAPQTCLWVIWWSQFLTWGFLFCQVDRKAKVVVSVHSISLELSPVKLALNPIKQLLLITKINVVLGYHYGYLASLNTAMFQKLYNTGGL